MCKPASGSYYRFYHYPFLYILGSGQDPATNNPLVLAASILATAINGAQQQQANQVSNIQQFKILC